MHFLLCIVCNNMWGPPQMDHWTTSPLECHGPLKFNTNSSKLNHWIKCKKLRKRLFQNIKLVGHKWCCQMANVPTHSPLSVLWWEFSVGPPYDPSKLFTHIRPPKWTRPLDRVWIFFIIRSFNLWPMNQGIRGMKLTHFLYLSPSRGDISIPPKSMIYRNHVDSSSRCVL